VPNSRTHKAELRPSGWHEDWKYHPHMSGDLHTTNTLLAIMAAVSVIEVLMVIAAGIALWTMYKRVLAVSDRAMALADRVVSQDLPPVIARVNAILDDVKDVSAVVKHDSEWINSAVRSTVDRIETATGHVRSTVSAKTRWASAAFRGLRFALSALASSRR